MTTTSLPPSDLRSSLEIIEVKPGLKFTKSALQNLLPDVETALFFGKVYELNYVQLSNLLSTVLKSKLATELFAGNHSTELQDYLVDITTPVSTVSTGKIKFKPDVPKGEILPELWKSLEIQVAQGIKDVAAKLSDVVNHMPGKQGEMLFKSMRVLNAKRPTIGDYRAHIHHARQQQNLVILDVSGSMTEETVEAIVEDVVALSYVANAHFAIVSNTCTHWEPGTYDTAAVLDAAEFGGTYYEELRPLLDMDWGVVVTIADYDSSQGAKGACARGTGSIGEVLDISLVDRPTFLAECVGQKASSVRPLLVAATARTILTNNWY